MATTFGAAATAPSLTGNAHKSSTYLPLASRHFFLRANSNKVSFRLTPRPKLRLFSKGLQSGWKCSAMVKAQLNDVRLLRMDPRKLKLPKEVSPAESKDAPIALASEESISEFITQVASLVKLVDSKDIVELELKQLDCEVLIRKKEALAPPPPLPVAYVQSQPQPAVLPPVSTPSPAPTAAPSPPPAPALSPPKAQPAKSSHPPLKSPMAGTFYRSPAPGEPPFVKVGDKVQKGQVLCIIEAMKLMNEMKIGVALHPINKRIFPTSRIRLVPLTPYKISTDVMPATINSRRLFTILGNLPHVSSNLEFGVSLSVHQPMVSTLWAKADQSGKIVEILLEDGKPVSVDTVSFSGPISVT
ncbi:UNVERIFIED_CONTAM: Biotin carboxyl carrier protein of acetyl-CoA carboxylase 1, chloroplastic [Sesamum angustifolium]|uniref:Biotin carboxyl carrier protein of acetyl-CoA carboxylase 1, chloroplastic n=1 Tax=Sesamum angustifolium TaxID=2727405 RepID=A0AAW2LEL1_9LAMI